jgi:hypothetical protein
MRSITIPALVATTLLASPAFSKIGEGDLAPLHSSVDEKTRTIDMTDFVDGVPLVFLYASTVDNRTGDPVFQTAWTRD